MIPHSITKRLTTIERATSSGICCHGIRFEASTMEARMKLIKKSSRAVLMKLSQFKPFLNI